MSSAFKETVKQSRVFRETPRSPIRGLPLSAPTPPLPAAHTDTQTHAEHDKQAQDKQNKHTNHKGKAKNKKPITGDGQRAHEGSNQTKTRDQRETKSGTARPKARPDGD